MTGRLDRQTGDTNHATVVVEPDASDRIEVSQEIFDLARFERSPRGNLLNIHRLADVEQQRERSSLYVTVPVRDLKARQPTIIAATWVRVDGCARIQRCPLAGLVGGVHRSPFLSIRKSDLHERRCARRTAGGPSGGVPTHNRHTWTSRCRSSSTSTLTPSRQTR